MTYIIFRPNFALKKIKIISALVSVNSKKIHRLVIKRENYLIAGLNICHTILIKLVGCTKYNAFKFFLYFLSKALYACHNQDNGGLFFEVRP